GSAFRSDNVAYIGSGQYNITISASDPQFNGYGIKSIDVNASKQFYYNQSESVTIKFLGETTPISPVRVPDKVYYTAAETFNISLYYEDSVKSIGVSGATITVDVGGTVYNPTALTDYGDGNYDMIIDCSDAIFSSYGVFPIRINVTKTNYYNQTYTLDTLIVGNESLTVLAPNTGAVYITGQSFDINIEYVDTILSTGIDGATIEYSLNGGSTFKSTGVSALGSGQYNITIDVSDADFVSFGFVDIIIDASKQHYENRSTTYTFHRQITTQITPRNVENLGTVIKGLNVTYTFNYSDTSLNPIDRVNWTRISADENFGAWLENLGNGNYTMHLDTTNVLVTGVPYVYEFIVYAVGNETQTLSLTVDVLIIDTDVKVNSYIPLIARNSALNQTVKFYFNDTTNNLPVLNVATNNIIVKNYATGLAFGAGQFWLYDPYNNGTYILDITMGTRNSGWYTLEVNASKFPNYDYTLFNVTFYFRGNYTDINLISLSDPSGPLVPTGLYNYTIFEGSDLLIEFNITDSEFLDTLIVGDADLYTVRYTNLGTGSNGVLVTSLNFITFLHRGTIFTSNPALTVGRYLLNLTTSRSNYEDAWFTFNLTITAKYQTYLTLIYTPTQINAGDELTIIFKAEYDNGTTLLPIVNGAIRMTPYFNGLLSTIQNDNTNSSGEVKFTIITGSNVRSINITIELLVAYNYQNKIYDILASDITVIPPTPPLTFEDFLPYIIIIGAALAVVVTAVATYRGVVVPKKKEKQRILTEVKTIFDDAINLEHILVLYKGTGTCIFFKSYGSEQIDPELIGGFLSAVSSFGKEMATQAALNEISYGDKMLLLADGYLIRVALVLGKNASLILRRHLKEFIEMFENTYKDILPNWRGQLNYFKNAGMIVDDILNTSIILPHQISYDFSSVKDLKNPHSREILKVAQSCCEEAEREFFFIATLLKEASDRTSQDTAEIFMGIKELRDKKMLIPIEISAIEAQPISQQELNLINQKVGALTNLTSEEKQKLVQDLSQLGPIEREAYLTSLTKRAEIVTAPIKTSVEGLDVDNKKSAKKGIKELLKRGKMAHGKKDYIRAIELYESAAMLASNWELSDDYLKIEETIRKTKIEDLMEKKTNLENEAKGAVKAKNYAEAAAKYKYASRMASEIFKLGDTAMTKEVKRLTNKSNEYEKLK
ncbi:MAG: PKD domain-containing protein, partial [Candidatus Hermodarchaeota archaeon]